jgi:hypothetical protein
MGVSRDEDIVRFWQPIAAAHDPLKMALPAVEWIGGLVDTCAAGFEPRGSARAGAIA